MPPHPSCGGGGSDPLTADITGAALSVLCALAADSPWSGMPAAGHLYGWAALCVYCLLAFVIILVGA